MPYRSRRSYVRRSVRKSTRRPRRVANYRRSRYARRVLAPEQKSVVTAASIQIDNGGTIQYVSNVTKGTTDQTRVGNKIVLKSLWLKSCIRTPTTAADQYVRVVVIEDKKPSGALPTWTTIWNTVNPYSFRNEDYITRFRIWHDRMINVNRPSESDSLIPHNWYRKTFRPIFYNDGVAGTVADCQQSAFYIGVIGSEVNGSTDAYLDYNFKITFTDV